MQKTTNNTASPSLWNGEDRILNTREVAEMLRLKPATLEKARSTGMGNYPPFVRLGGRRVGYWLADVLEWIRANSFNIDGTRAYPKGA